MLLPLMFAFLIFTATCLLTPDEVPKMPDTIPWDKWVHFILFFGLSALNYFYYYRAHDGKPDLFRWLLYGFVVPVIYGGVIELLQGSVFILRSAEWSDFFADMAGSAFATLLVFCCRYRAKTSRKHLSL